MKNRAPYILLALALAFALFLLEGNESFSRRAILQEQVKLEHERTEALERRVDAMHQRVLRLGADDRYLEEVVREEVGMAKENELVFLFDDKGDGEAQ